MRRFSKTVSPPLRVLMAAGLSLAGLAGCAPTEADAPDQKDPAGVVTGTATSGLQVTYYDFIANAPGAAWHNNNGGVPWGVHDTRGTADMNTGGVEGGSSPTYLRTETNRVANGFMHASYTVTIPAASQHPTVTATFGFVAFANPTDGMTFALKTQINGSWVTLFSQYKTWTGSLMTKTADLSAYGGQTLQLFLTVDSGSNINYDVGAWTDFRITADSVGTPAGGCTINNVAYADGTVNPAVPCQVCEAITSASTWTTRADSCLIGGTCYAADQKDGPGCRRCDPLTSQTSWTSQTACDNLVVATTNLERPGNWRIGLANRSLPDDTCAAEGAALGLPGTWKAMWSDPDVRNFKDTVLALDATKPVVNLQGSQLFASWNDMFTNQVWPSGISMYKFGSSPTSIVGSAFSGGAWTGSNATGVWDSDLQGQNCNTWKDKYGLWSYYARVADYSQRKILDSGYTSGNLVGCAIDKPFQCVLIPPGPQVTVQNYDGTAEGIIQGVSDGDTLAYLGIPYAAPPTGNLRLAPPAKATSWSGVRNAVAQGAACLQPTLLPSSTTYGSEDCLFLNVWAPKTATPSSNLPVLVFQHGGAHIFGGTASSDAWLATGFYDGDRFAAAQNAVFVTIQTRIGPLGYLADPALAANPTTRTSTVGGGTSGNYGLLDAIQALKWVKRNIAAFGGNPAKVTFFGQSSGASVVCDLLASPLAKDPADNLPLFSSVIMESGFCEAPSTAFRHTQATAALTTIGCNNATDKVACLRAAPLQNFVNAVGDVLGFFPLWLGGPLPPEFGYGLSFGPHVDGYVLPTHARQMIAAGTHNKVPAIVGTNKDEGNFFMLFMVGGILTGDLPNLIVLGTCTARATKLTTNLGTTLANAAMAIYPCPSTLLGPTLTYAEGITHAQYECPARRTARALDLGQTQPVRRYWFTHSADHLGVFQNVLGIVPQVGAAHTFEIPFIFNTHNTMLGYWPSARERALGTAMQTYWRTFAATGNPNYSGGVNWPEYDRTIDNTLKLEVSGAPGGIQTQNGINTAKCDFWDNNYNLDGWK